MLDFFQQIPTVIQQILETHAAVASLFGLAVIVSMPEKLPAPLDRVAVLCWLYAWVHDALKTFVSFRSPRPVPPQTEQPK
jgi:hypothetical protein